MQKKGDILIYKGNGYNLGQQSYKVNIGNQISVYAKTNTGVFNGLRTILKLMILSGNNMITKAYIHDYPDAKERTVHLDCARKYYSPSWIKPMIKEMSWMGFNALEIHFSEDQGLRLESKKYPWLAGSVTNDKYLTQDQMASICKVAKKYQIEIIPSLDSPGHLDYVVKTYKKYVEKHPDFTFRYNGKTYSKDSKGFYNISNYLKYNGQKSAYNYRGIDLANSTARVFIASLINEYADFFKEQGCTKFNIGGDELLGWSTDTLGGRTFTFSSKWQALQHWDNYAKNTLKISNGNASDTFISYLNSVAKRLKKRGYTCRVFSDEIYRNSNQHVKLDSEIDIVYWSNAFRPVNTFTSRNHTVYNAVEQWTYYVIRYDSSGNDYMNTTYRTCNAANLFNNWDPKSTSSPGNTKKYIPSDNFGGAYFCIWSDYPNYKTTATVWNEVQDRMWVSAAKMWNRQQKIDYTAYKKVSNALKKRPGA